MRIQVEYDANGQIKSVAGLASMEFPDGSRGTTGRIPSPGNNLVEIESEHVRHERDIDGLRKLVDGYRVTGHPEEPKLEPTRAEGGPGVVKGSPPSSDR